MNRHFWLIIALLLLVLSFDNFLQALNWFHDAEDSSEAVNRSSDEASPIDKAKHVVENVASSGKRAKESLEAEGKRAASTISKNYEEKIAKPLRHWREDDLWSSQLSHWFDSSRPWTHSIASLGQFRTFPNEYIVYLDMPGVPKEEIEIFVPLDIPNLGALGLFEA